MKESIRKLITTYENVRDSLLSELSMQREQGEPALARAVEPASNSGILPLSGAKFELHGIGCRFEGKDGTVIEVDAGSGATLGFNAWQLACFAESSSRSPKDLGEIEAELRRAEESGELKKGTGAFAHLYFPRAKN